MKLNWTSRCVFTRKSFALLLLLFVGNLTVLAQAGSKAVKVTISPKSGNIISTRSESAHEAGSEGGYGSFYPQSSPTYVHNDRPTRVFCRRIDA